MVGAVEEIIERLIQESQEVLAEVGEAKTVTEPVKQRLLSTFNYWEDQLRGDVDASLATKKKNLQALREMVTLLRQVRKGLNTKGKIQLEMAGEVRQWAYRSKIDGTDQPYSLYVPSSYDPKRAYSLLIGLHGYSGDDVESLQKLLGGYRPEDFLVVAPLGRGDLGYRSLGEVDVLDVIQEIQTFYHINPDRIYLTGWSMGGSGTWRLGQLYPHRFAAIAPFCGWTGISFLVNMRNLPAMVVHGAADPVIPVYLDQMAANFLQEYLGAPLDYHELPGVGHDVWTEWVKLKGNKGLFDYFRKHKRNPWPKRVSIIINHLRYAKQYWVEVQELATPLAVGQMDVRVIDDKNITVQTKDVAAFTLNLTHPDLAQTGTVMVKVDGVDIRVPAGQEEAFFCVQEESGLFHSRKPPKRSRVKNEGGGLSDLFTSSLYIVYGTRVPERREALRRMAEIIADWRVGPEMRMGVKVGKFRVKADRDITEEEIKGSSLLLLGSPVENRLLERSQAELPVKWMKDGVEVEEVYYPNLVLPLFVQTP